MQYATCKFRAEQFTACAMRKPLAADPSRLSAQRPTSQHCPCCCNQATSYSIGGPLSGTGPSRGITCTASAVCPRGCVRSRTQQPDGLMLRVLANSEKMPPAGRKSANAKQYRQGRSALATLGAMWIAQLPVGGRSDRQLRLLLNHGYPEEPWLRETSAWQIRQFAGQPARIISTGKALEGSELGRGTGQKGPGKRVGEPLQNLP